MLRGKVDANARTSSIVTMVSRNPSLVADQPRLIHRTTWMMMRPGGMLRRRWDIAPPVATLLTGVILVAAAGFVWPSQACSPEDIAAQSATTAPPASSTWSS